MDQKGLYEGGLYVNLVMSGCITNTNCFDLSRWVLIRPSAMFALGHWFPLP